ncbi:hypothetical protein, partial [Microbacterium testaceum]|uniref:hypothetical protein n=1 Tax=Microbacterium testaceum TaxID=2033 RepID=UPI00128F2614
MPSSSPTAAVVAVAAVLALWRWTGNALRAGIDQYVRYNLFYSSGTTASDRLSAFGTLAQLLASGAVVVAVLLLAGAWLARGRKADADGEEHRRDEGRCAVGIRFPPPGEPGPGEKENGHHHSTGGEQLREGAERRETVRGRRPARIEEVVPHVLIDAGPERVARPEPEGEDCRHRGLLLGIALATGLFTRMNNVVGLVLVVVLGVVLLRRRLLFAAAVVAAVVAVAAVLALWLWTGNALRAGIDQYVRYNLFYS